MDANDRRQGRIEQIRAMCTWLEMNPDADLPSLGEHIYDYTASRDEMVARARELGGRWQKGETDSDFRLVREILPGVNYIIFAARENVCERKVVGTEKVMVPDPAAPLVEQEREVVEWVCPESLLAEVTS